MALVSGEGVHGKAIEAVAEWQCNYYTCFAAD
jgi:hypothetical protein